MKVGIIGQGYVGQTLAIGAADSGLEVIGFDLDLELVSNLRNGSSFVPGISRNTLISLVKSGLYNPSTNFELLDECRIIVIAVPTPIDQNRNPDLSFVLSACDTISRYVKSSALIISESTSYPGTLRNVIKTSIQNSSSIDFEYAVAPERVDPGNTLWNLRNTTRVISGLTESATDQAIKFYSNFCDSIYRASSPEVAEAAKLLENTFRQVNIALVNELSNILAKLEISANEVVNAAASKPFGFMKFIPGIGVGGHCIPVDPEYLTFLARSVGASSPLIDTANQINLARPENVITRIESYLGIKLSGLNIQIAGIAYKPGVSDLRESPVIELIYKLRDLGATVTWHDPVVRVWMDEVSTPLDSNIDLGLIVTPHGEINLDSWKMAGIRVIDLSSTSENLGWPKIL